MCFVNRPASEDLENKTNSKAVETATKRVNLSTRALIGSAPPGRMKVGGGGAGCLFVRVREVSCRVTGGEPVCVCVCVCMLCAGVKGQHTHTQIQDPHTSAACALYSKRSSGVCKHAHRRLYVCVCVLVCIHAQTILQKRVCVCVCSCCDVPL